jgi:hypothetical protein
MLERMRVQVVGLEPRYTLPFASYVWFCHEENAFLNAYHNRVRRAVEFLRETTHTQPIVMSPGDRWELATPHDPEPALARWDCEYDSLRERPLVRAPRVAESDLIELAAKWCEGVRSHSDPLRLRLRLARQAARARRAQARNSTVGQALAALGLVALTVPKAWIWVSDLDAAFSLSLTRGLRRATRPRDRCDVELGSDSLRFAFQFLFGGETLLVNARFRELRPNSRAQLFGYFGLAGGRNRAEEIGWAQLFRKWVGR